MRKVATINGVAVYSDKQLTGIKGTRIDFADGSCCDVLTNTTVNNGPGDIQIGEIPRTTSKAPKTSTSGDPYRTPGTVGETSDPGNAIGPTRYPCNRLHIADLPANVLIEVWDRSDM